jgi:hypothetical protein
VAAAAAGLLPLRGVVLAVAAVYTVLAVAGALLAPRAAAPVAAPDRPAGAVTLATP